MKTILVLTDFSNDSVHTSHVAARLAGKMHAGILLWSYSLKIPTLTGYLGGATEAKTILSLENRKKLELAAQDLQNYMSASAGKYRPSVNIRFREAVIKENLISALAVERFEMIVMDASLEGVAEHLFTPSHTDHALQNFISPVMLVPPKAVLEELDKIVFATDFNPADLLAISDLHKLSVELDFRIEIVHLTINGEKDAEMMEKEALFIRGLRDMKTAKILYREIRGMEVANRLNRISKQTHADILSMSNQYSSLRSIFSSDLVTGELSHQRVPLLLFPLVSEPLQSSPFLVSSP